MGNFAHENIAMLSNDRTAYQGADSNPGYLYKFVADSPQDLSSGALYVYSGSKNGPGNWIQLANSTPAERNTTLSQSAAVGATVFNGIEDVEIGPDGWVYFAVKGEDQVYRFQDSDPISGTTVPQMETYVGNASYDIVWENGVTTVDWGTGNDNLAFDNQGNLWVNQDGGDNYIWVVRAGHTQASPQVDIFARAPFGSESTGITFTPDNNFMFLSLQHPLFTNGVTVQTDAAGEDIGFANDITLVIGLKGILGNACPAAGTPCDDGDNTTLHDMEDGSCNCAGLPISGNPMYLISNGSDDSEEANDGSIDISSSDIELVDDPSFGGNGNNQTIGLRFRDVMIPAGATITNAYIQFTVDETDSGTTNVNIVGNNVDDALPFSEMNNDISSRTATSTIVAWNNIPDWDNVGEAGPLQQTPDLSALVQEIVSRPGWMPGNALAFMFSGSGERTAEAFEGEPASAAKLILEYDVPPCPAPTNTAYTILSTTSVKITWDAVPGAVSYQVRYRLKTADNSAPWQLAGATGSSRTLTGLVNARLYEYRVRVFCNGQWSALSELDRFFMATCDMPTNLAWSQYPNGDYKLEWDNVPDFVKYQIRLRVAGTSAWQVLGTTPGNNFKRFTGANALAPSTTYEYRVRAYCTDDSWSQFTPNAFYTTMAARLLGNALEQVSEFYPNPAEDILHWNYSAVGEGEVSLQMMDALGRVVLQRQVSNSLPGNNNMKVDVSGLSNGIYFIKTTYPDGTSQVDHIQIK